MVRPVEETSGQVALDPTPRGAEETPTKGAVVVAVIGGAARKEVGQDPRVTCREKSGTLSLGSRERLKAKKRAGGLQRREMPRTRVATKNKQLSFQQTQRTPAATTTCPSVNTRPLCPP